MINLKGGISGVYKITNKVSGEFYIGASVDIRMRYGTHMGRDARKYQHTHRFYSDIMLYGKENFELEILTCCERNELLKWEQYYYDSLKPSYNKVRPAENNFIHDDVRLKASKNSNTISHINKRKELYNSPEYKEYFRNVHVNQMKPVVMLLDDEELKSFISIQEASRYISETTDFKGKNKTSKIKAVCDGERKSAYGFRWEYKEV